MRGITRVNPAFRGWNWNAFSASQPATPPIMMATIQPTCASSMARLLKGRSARVSLNPVRQLEPLFGKFEPRLGLKRRRHPFRFLFALDCFLATKTLFVRTRCRIGGDLRRKLRFPQRRLNWRRSDCAAPPSRRCIELGIFRANFRALNRCTHTTHSTPHRVAKTKEAAPGCRNRHGPSSHVSPGVRGGSSCDDCLKH
jgi:hypothetical protein